MNFRNVLLVGAATMLAASSWSATPSVAQTPPPSEAAAVSRPPSGLGDGPEPLYPHSLGAQAWRMAHRNDGLTSQAPAVAQRSISLSRNVVEAAAVFALYVENAGDLDADLTDGDEVAASVEEGAAYEPHQLAEGAVAYAALVALQDPDFVEGVGTLAADRSTAQALAAKLIAQPAGAAELPGARSAAARASLALRAHGEALAAAGKAFRQAAYDVQKQPWSQLTVAHPEERLATVKAISSARRGLQRDEIAEAVQHLVKAADLRQSTASESGAPTPLVARGLALAALAVLGQAGDAQSEALGKLIADPEEADCLNLAKLNLFQCLAVAGPQYEHMFCLGEHSLYDTGQCLSAAAGKTRPAPSTLAAAVAEAHAEDVVAVPVATFAAARDDQAPAAPRTR